MTGAPLQQPLSASWREWITGPQWEERQWAGPAFDAIVIGSGYGGSVAALRLAQKGYRVLLLERGSEYLPGEFPNDFSLVPKYFRINVPGRGLPLGRASGLVEVHLGEGMVAVTGNGLGGGSLVNAGVAMAPDPEVFAQEQWPSALRHGHAPGLQRFFDRAAEKLELAEWDSTLPGGERLRKTAALDRLAGKLGASTSRVRLTIDPEKCLRCGDCASGCNTAGAKRTLSSTYLREALDTGRVQIVTQAEVYRFEQKVDVFGRHQGWRVHAFATDAQQHYLATREVFSDRQPSATTRTLVAPLLFVCAGTLGSTQLLQRSQALAGGALAFTPALGTRVSGNGDSLSGVVNEPEVVGGLGRGQSGVDQWIKARAGAKDYSPEDIVGPTITAAIDLRQAAAGEPPLPLERRLVIEDGAVPRTLAQLYREVLATASTLKQLDDWWFDAPARSGGEHEDPLAASDHQAQHTQLLLAMGHDGSPARLVWLEGLDRSAPYLPHPERLATYIEQQKLFERMGRRHVHNPLWHALPDDAARLMSGPKPSQTVTTVHPLGGCVMSDHPDGGVVDHHGQVWVHDPGRGFIGPDAMDCGGREAYRNEPRRYKGLFVLDGSIVPTALGCNPLWTITALAERALDAFPAKTDAVPAAPPQRSAQRAPQALPSQTVPIAALLNEELLARDLAVRGSLARHLGGKLAAARLRATFTSPDLAADLRTRRHRLDTDASLVIGPLIDGQPAQGSLEYRAEAGRFNVLPAGRGASGPALVLRGSAEIALLLALLVAFGAGLVEAQWRIALAVFLLFAVLAVVLPFSRTLITWLTLRGVRDIREHADKRALSALLVYGTALLKQLFHASEKREMRYRLPMRLVSPAVAPPGVPEEITLHARKTVVYRAGIRELLAWIFRRRQRRDDGRLERVRVRRTLWQQVMDAQVRIVAGDRPMGAPALATGVFRMGFDKLTASGLSSGRRFVRGPMELGLNGDTTSGMLALAGYPLLFLRYALKTRLLDFRMPSYSKLPVPDQASAEETHLRTPQGRVDAELQWVEVQRGASSGDLADESTEPLRLQLWRYRQRDAQGRPRLPEILPGEWLGQEVARARCVLLLHAFGQSGLSYTLKTVQQNLAERFHEAGYEVWILEMRMSTRSGYAGRPCSVDQIACHDVPVAVRHILRQLRQEARRGEADPPLQISAFGQCIGSAALAMALLSGRLSYRKRATVAVRGYRPQMSMLSHAMFSQVHPWVVGARGPQSKTWMPALLKMLWPRGSVPFAVRGPQEGMIVPLLDRLFASMPVPRGEDRRPAGHDDAAATCKRIRFIEAPLFKHENINDATFAAMNLLFGDANLRLFAHARRFVDRERLVDEDGINRYVTDANLREHLALPVQLLHGAENELFDWTSVRRTFAGLRNFHEGWQQAFCRGAEGKPAPLVIPGYGHLDVLIGQNAWADVFPQVVGFFNACLAQGAHDVGQREPGGWVPRPPRIGPFVGWLRRDRAQAMLRLSFVIDDRSAMPTGDALPPIRLRYRPAGQDRFVTLPTEGLWKPLKVGNFGGRGPNGAAEPAAHRLAWADIALPDGHPAATAEDWQVFTLHESWFRQRPGGKLQLLEGPDAPDARLDAFLAVFLPEDKLGPIEPPLSDGGHDFDFAGAQFRLPAVALASLPEGSEVPFTIACCRYPGLGVDLGRVDHSVRRLLEAQAQRPAAFAMLLGDQIYADATAGLVDPTSPLERYYERHELAFGRRALGELLAAMPVYMTPDDHEWVDAFPHGSPLVRERWPDWAGGSGFEQRQQRAFRIASKAITAFQRLQSPIGGQARPRYRFDHGCARFFCVDSRQWRDRNEQRVVGAGFMAGLRRWLEQPAARDSLNVLVCGTVVLPGLRANADPANPGNIDTWQFAPGQRQELLELLVGLAPGRFLLLSGDYHVSGAALLRQGERTVGAAVLSPPLYAPLPYANTTPEAVFDDEVLPLAGGDVRLEVPQQGSFARGSGFGSLKVRRVGGGFEIDLRRDLWVWETGEAASFDLTMRLG